MEALKAVKTTHKTTIKTTDNTCKKRQNNATFNAWPFLIIIRQECCRITSNNGLSHEMTSTLVLQKELVAWPIMVYCASPVMFYGHA